MTAHKDIRPHPKHNSRIHPHVPKAPARVDDFGLHFSGWPFRWTVRAVNFRIEIFAQLRDSAGSPPRERRVACQQLHGG
ncbi:hypothetical protein [Bradyrhizobium uaiense]|uniref:Uncharacterized protein n=1 Tax=Bradyrhizobium uaiense TaxID=2594946 RepID=A0A6P1BWA4_9BRAD|nr:hypothetical protein [Bradyrhizobium uaiense]NEV02535.1 hypothetical protein [Bradyrhizobium uaiense]